MVSNMGMKTKRIILVIAIIIAILIVAVAIGRAVYKHIYLNSYRDIELEKIAQIQNDDWNFDFKRWYSVESETELKKIGDKYSIDIDLPEIDYKKYMLIISFGAELEKLDYSLMESLYKTKQHYIAFETFGKSNGNTVYVYRTPVVPIYNSEEGAILGGHHYTYRGKFRD